MAEINRKQTTTTETTKESQTKYVGQSKTPVTPPVAPKIDVTKPSSAPSANQPTPNIAKPATLPTQTISDNSPGSAPQSQSGQAAQPGKSANTPSTPSQAPSAPSSPVYPSANSATPTSSGTPSGEQPQDEQDQQQQNQPDKEKDKKKKEEEDKKKKEEPEKEKAKKEGEKEDEKAPKTKEPGPAEGKSDVSPSLEKDFQNKPKVDLAAKDAAKNKAGSAVAKEGIKDGAEAVGKKAVATGAKQGAKVAIKAAAKVAAQAILAALQAALDAVIAFFGWPVLIGCAIITILGLAMILIFIFISLKGVPGKTFPQTAGSSSAIVKDLKDINAAAAGGLTGVINAVSFHKFDYLNDADKTFVNDGKADHRLLEALKYLSGKHNRIATSHIISGYQNMSTNPESGVDRDPNLTSNVSAHKEGLASDISEIDFVYKSLEPSKICNGADGSPPLNDIVYYSDGMADNVPATNAVPTNQDITTANTFSDLSTASKDLSDSLNQINVDPNANRDATNKVNDAKAKVNDLTGKLQQDSAKIQTYSQNITTVQAKIETFRATINSSSLDQTLKDQYTKSLNDLATKLVTSSGVVQQLSNVTSNLQVQMNTITTDLQKNINDINGNVDKLNQQIDKLNQGLAMFTNLQSISQIQGLDQLSGYLGNINAGFDQVTNAIKDNIPDISDISGGLLGNMGGFGEFFGGNNELLRLYCEGGPATGVPNKTAIPIKVTWQDSKPDITHVSAEADESTTTDPRVFYSVYQPEARKKVHQVIAELLQFPYDKGDTSTYKVTQLITYSQERDVTPFSALLDKLYGASRPANYGLFSMPESWAQVHIAY